MGVVRKSPVLLVVNCESMARSAAAVVKGFQLFADGPHIAGVIVNKVGSEGHFQLVKKAIEQECDVPVIGYLKRELDIEMPERHLGLIPSIERGELDPFFDTLGDLVLETVDIDKLLEISLTEPLVFNESDSIFKNKKKPFVKIAVSKDAAFNFYYPENLEMLEANGAELVYFSPLADEELPEDIDGLYIGGGFPEEFAHELSCRLKAKRSVKAAVESGLPTLAECGGFMYLTDSIETTEKKKYEMVGVIPGSIHMQSHLAGFGYREINGLNANFMLKNQTARGHEFHYSSFRHAEENVPYAYETKGMGGLSSEGYLVHNVAAGYTHFHFASCPAMVENWIKKCLEHKAGRKGNV